MDLKLPVLRMEVKQLRKTEPRVVERLLALIEVAKVCQDWDKARESDILRIATRSETSARTLYRWIEAYQAGGVQALIPKSSPGRKPKPIRGWVAKRIREYRKLYNWGAEVIKAHLEHDHGIVISQDRIHRFLKKKGLSRKKIRKRGSKHTRVVKVEQPGTHTQTDVKHLPKLLENGQKCYVYNFVDHASRWTYKRAYDSYGPSETRDFMQRVIKLAPFTITRAQTDNGIEFTFRYVSHADDPRKHALDEICASHGIRHVLIPPGEKELQGLVERSHRQDDEELYHRIKPKNLEQFNRELEKHAEWLNSKRRRKALGWKTSLEFLDQFLAKVHAWIYENQPSPFLPVENLTEGSHDEKNLTPPKAA